MHLGRLAIRIAGGPEDELCSEVLVLAEGRSDRQRHQFLRGPPVVGLDAQQLVDIAHAEVQLPASLALPSQRINSLHEVGL